MSSPSRSSLMMPSMPPSPDWPTALIPWAHVIVGERAMLRAAEMIYDLPEYVPRHWDPDEHGHKKGNKWRAWTTLDEQGYINNPDVAEFRRLVRDAGFRIARDDAHSVGGSRLQRAAGRMLMSVPLHVIHRHRADTARLIRDARRS